MINRQTFLKSLIGIPIIGKLIPEEKISDLPDFKHSFTITSNKDKIDCYSDVNPNSPSFRKGFNVINGKIIPVTSESDWRVTKQRVTIGTNTFNYSLEDVNRGSKTFGRTIDTIYYGSIFEVEKWANDKLNSGEIKLI